MRDMSRLFSMCILCLTFANAIAEQSIWQKLDEGLFWGEFTANQKSIHGDSKITVIKIDPQYYEFKLLCSGELNEEGMTAKQWVEKYELIGAINAGMYQMDYMTNVGYMKNFSYKNNPRKNRQYNSVAAFNPIDPTSTPAFQMFDVQNGEMQSILEHYNTVVQNLRLIKSPGLNQWSQSNRKWSEAALGQDKDGNALFIFCVTPYSMHDLNECLKNLPLNIDRAHHLEGGPEASLYFAHNDFTIARIGFYETGFVTENTEYWPIPNVIGIVKK